MALSRHNHLFCVCTTGMTADEMSERRLSLYISYYWWLPQALSNHKYLQTAVIPGGQEGQCHPGLYQQQWDQQDQWSPP